MQQPAKQDWNKDERDQSYEGNRNLKMMSLCYQLYIGRCET